MISRSPQEMKPISRATEAIRCSVYASSLAKDRTSVSEIAREPPLNVRLADITVICRPFVGCDVLSSFGLSYGTFWKSNASTQLFLSQPILPREKLYISTPNTASTITQLLHSPQPPTSTTVTSVAANMTTMPTAAHIKALHKKLDAFTGPQSASDLASLERFLDKQTV